MSRHQRDLFADAVRVYKDLRAELPGAVPFWPLGLPRWDDSWIALGLRAPGTSYLTVWHRGPLAAASTRPGGRHPSREDADPAEVTLPIPHLGGQRGQRGRPVTPRILYPAAGAGLSWDPGTSALTVSLPRKPSACVLSLA